MNTKSKILVVDDDEDICDIIVWVLEEEGYEVSGLNDGSAVISTVQSLRPDLVLLDVQLGGHDGREICRQLKDQKITQNIPIIMISANHHGHEMYDKRCNADDFLAKPFDIGELIDHVKRFAA